MLYSTCFGLAKSVKFHHMSYFHYRVIARCKIVFDLL